MNYTEVMTTFRKLALDAGEKIMEIYNASDFEVKIKGDSSPVTEADEAADAIISVGLRLAYPGVTLITEEQSDTHVVDASTFFIVDPLDGTKEFIQRRGDFTVNIAYVESGQPILGVVYAPAKGRLFYTDGSGRAIEETGSFRVDQLGDRKALTVNEPDNAALMVVASKSHRDAATDAYINRYAVSDCKSAGSSLKFCLVASGEADFYPRLGRTMEWDTAAGDAILRAAGGVVVRAADLQPLVYGKAGWDNPHFLAAAPGVQLKPENVLL